MSEAGDHGCRGYWKDVANVEAEVLKFMECHGAPGCMPSCAAMRLAGSHSLAYAIRKHGGQQAIARRLGCVVSLCCVVCGFMK